VQIEQHTARGNGDCKRNSCGDHDLPRFPPQ
jgi:hypothetical protein